VMRLAVVGLGKMGLSHHALINAHPDVELAAVCDSSRYVLSVLSKYTEVATYSDYERMLREVDLNGVLIATPSRFHAGMVRAALDRGLNVFCEKPFTLNAADSRELASLSRASGLVSQVGYHNRFVGAFREVKALVDAGAIGSVTHALGEAYGPVVVKAKGGTWRSRREEGGGCLYDYAAHPIDLLNWYLGEPVGVGGTVLNRIFSNQIDDAVCSTLFYSEGKTAQISVNWTDESCRKMSTQVTLWGTAGRIYADRQECRAYLGNGASTPPGYEQGWNVRYTTDLTEPVWFYLRGEEYSAQVDHFVQRVKDRRLDGVNGFESAAATDGVIAMMISDADKGASTLDQVGDPAASKRSRVVRVPRIPPRLRPRRGARRARAA
jgi:predicted dehydrogenase